MEWRIYVEDQEIDPPSDLSAQFTYAIDDIKHFAERNTSFSKTIIVPGTAKNRRQFGHIYEPSSANFPSTGPNIGYNFDTTKGARCFITLDGLPVFKGVLRIMEVVALNENVEFECAVFGELGGLITAMGDKRLEDLDFSAYNHTFSGTMVVNSWSAPLGSGYYYPLIDYGYSQDKVQFPLENFRPAFHIREYLAKIFAAAGYTWDCPFFETDYFKSLIVPFNQIFPSIEVSTLVHRTRTTSMNVSNVGAKVAWEALVGTSYFLLDVGTANNFTYKRAETIKPKITFTANYNRAGATFPCTMSVQLRDAGGVFAEQQQLFSGSASGSLSFEFTADIPPGKVFEVWVVMDVPTTFGITNTVFKMTGQPTIELPLMEDDTVEANRMIPKGVSQKDFLVSIIKMFNLMIDEDKVKFKHLIIKPWIQYYDTASRLDWTRKMDRSQPQRYKPIGELNSRTFEFKYKEDSDFYNGYYKRRFNENYGDFNFDTNIEYTKEKSTLDVIFAPSPLVAFDATTRVISVIAKKSDAGVWDRMASVPRIMFRSDAAIVCKQWTIKTVHATNTADSVSTFNSYPYAGHLDDPDSPANDLNFGAPAELYFRILAGALQNNIFNQFHSFYMSEITDKDSKVLIAKFQLTPQDIAQLDFSKLIFIDGMLYRLNKVSDYDTNGLEVTNCELLKVIDIV
jgi:hypothetical protein